MSKLSELNKEINKVLDNKLDRKEFNLRYLTVLLMMEDRKMHWYKFYFSNGIPPAVVALKTDMNGVADFLRHDDSILWAIGDDNEKPSVAINIKCVAYVIEIDGEEK